MRRLLRMSVIAAAVFGGWGVSQAAPAEPGPHPFPLQDGDTWVMVGDSITAQHLHTNYLEAYCFTRFPRWTIHFRNSGVGGDTIPKALARFARDAAVWKPTIVSVELGMNDSGAGLSGEAAYIQGMGKLTERILAIGARPVFLTSSPVNDGTTADKPAGRNLVLDKYSTSLSEYAKQQKAPFADQFHVLLDLWGRNKQADDLARFAVDAQQLAARKDTPHADLLRQWVDEWNRGHAGQHGVGLLGDAVHPGPPGQLTMCVALLRGLHAPGLVSKATVDARGRVVEAVQCEVTDVKADAGGLSFTRLDRCLPMPIPEDARPALALMPAIAELSQWMLTVTGLKAGEYEVSIDGAAVINLTAEALAKGCNLGTLEKGPVADQGRQVLALIVAKEVLVSQFRGKSAATATAPADQANSILEPLNQQVLVADTKTRAAAQPKPHRFVIAPVKPAAH